MAQLKSSEAEENKAKVQAMEREMGEMKVRRRGVDVGRGKEGEDRRWMGERGDRFDKVLHVTPGNGVRSTCLS